MLLKILLISLVVLSMYLIYMIPIWCDKLCDCLLKKYPPKTTRAVIQWCDACEARRRWHEAHPFASSSSPEAQRLLRIELGARMLFQEACPHVDSREIGWLSQQMEDWVL